MASTCMALLFINECAPDGGGLCRYRKIRLGLLVVLGKTCQDTGDGERQQRYAEDSWSGRSYIPRELATYLSTRGWGSWVAPYNFKSSVPGQTLNSFLYSSK